MGYSAGYIPGPPEWHWLEPTLRRLYRKEKIALAALAEAMDKVEKLRRMQAVLSHTIDEMYEDVKEEKDLARGFAEHEA